MWKWRLWRLFDKSFASHEKWSNKNLIKPRFVHKSASKKFLFDCQWGHEFEGLLNSITNNRWCPYCAHLKLCDNKNCESCFENSYASNEKSKFWSSKNNINSRYVFKESKINKYIFNCNECKNEFSMTLNGNTWCPFCKNKTELKLVKITKI